MEAGEGVTQVAACRKISSVSFAYGFYELRAGAGGVVQRGSSEG